MSWVYGSGDTAGATALVDLPCLDMSAAVGSEHSAAEVSLRNLRTFYAYRSLVGTSSRCATGLRFIAKQLWDIFRNNIAWWIYTSGNAEYHLPSMMDRPYHSFEKLMMSFGIQ